MQDEHQILKKVSQARYDLEAADVLIREYLPFIKSEVSKYTGTYTNESRDELQIAMIAFHEAILAYDRDRGTFLHYAQMIIRSRLIDHDRKEARHKDHISLDKENEEGDQLIDMITDGRDKTDEHMRLLATQAEILELSKVLETFGVSFKDLTTSSPKQERTKALIHKMIAKAKEDPSILDDLLISKKLPIQRLTLDKNERKVLERHRKYLVTMLVILTNGYEIIRGHLWRVLKGGTAV